MKSYRCIALALCSGLVVASAYGYGTVTENNPPGVYFQGTDYRVDYYPEYPPRIVILEPSIPGTPYWFSCYEGDNPAAIWSIGAAAGLGTVEVKVTGYGAHTYGASDVWLVQIAQTSGGGRLVELKISGNYGLATEGGGTLLANRVGRTLITGDVVAPPGAEAIDVARVDGPLEIGRDILSPVNVTYVAGDFSVNDIQASVTIGELWGTTTISGLIAGESTHFTCSDVVYGDIRLTSAGVHTGWIELSNVPRRYTSACSNVAPAPVFTCSGYPCHLIVGDLQQGAMVHLEEGAGEVMVYAIGGTLWIQGDVAYLGLGAVVMSDAAICVEGAVDMLEAGSILGDVTLGSVSGSMWTHDAVSGRIYIGTLSGRFVVGERENEFAATDDLDPFSGLLTIETLTGDIFLNTGFAPNPNLPAGTANVQIAQKASGALFVVNNDGRNVARDYWEAGAAVQIGSEPPFTGPNDQDLWAASCCKGDVDNSGDAKSFDIDPFVLLLTDADAYCATYPGLCEGSTYDPERGSARYRGDLNCDGAVNVFDIDPFVLKLTNPGPSGDPEDPGWYDLYPKSCGGCGWVLNCYRECCPGCVERGLPPAAAGMDAEAGGSSSASAEYVAGLLTAAVAAERLPALREIAETLASELADAERAEFWAAVAVELSGRE